jgi:hypothetical protein
MINLNALLASHQAFLSCLLVELHRRQVLDGRMLCQRYIDSARDLTLPEMAHEIRLLGNELLHSIESLESGSDHKSPELH